MSLSANVGTIDRVLRLVIGVALIALPYVLSSPLWENPVLRIGAPIVGLVLIATASMRFCPLYRLLGASTCRVPGS